MLVSAKSGKISITASDGQVTFTSDCEAEVKSEDSVIIPGRMLSEFSRYFGKSIFLESDGTSATVTSGKSQFSLSASPGSRFPKWLEFPDVLGKLDSGDFADAVRIVNMAAARNDPVLRAIRVDIIDGKLLMVSTDRSRMALASPQLTAVTLKADVSSPGPVLVPASVLERFSHVLGDEVSFGWNASLAGVATEGLTVTAPQVSGEFAKGWEMITRDYPPEIPVNGAELASSVKMATLAAGDRGTVKLSFGDVLTVSASQDAGYRGELEWEALGDEGIAGVTREQRSFDFTPRYLLDGISLGDDISLAYTGRAFLITCGDVRYLVQPRRTA